MEQRRLFAFFCGLLILPLSSIGTVFVHAQSDVERLQEQIADRNDRLTAIEQEIAQYEAALLEVGAEKDTLQKTINSLELERKKVLADIRYTENQISSTDLEINKLTLEIGSTERDIGKNENAIAEIIRSISHRDDDTLLELMLRHKNLSEFWNEVEDLETVRDSIQTQVHTLVSLKILLEEKHDQETEHREDLVDLKQKYDGQQVVLANNRQEKDTLLEQTENEEDKFQALLAQQQAARDQLTREIRDFESQLQFILDPNTIPPEGTPVFNWPLDNVIITQYFGGTEFAKRNAHVYGGRPYHPGVDFGASRGTPIKAPLAGTVRAIGNTDAVPGCYSWGKWILIDHANGLSTLYAHQDANLVSPGQSVATGETIGLVGNTGYSTGPHLHFTVYVSEAVTVRRFNEIKTVTGCGAATTPTAATDAYLDPMSYLPSV